MIDKITTEEITLELKQFGKRLEIPNEVIQNTEIIISEEIGRTIINSVTQILGKDIREIEIKYPKNWKEAIKERFLPDFFKKYFPVKYKKHEIKASVLYLKIPLHQKKHFLYQEHKTYNFEDQNVGHNRNY